MKYLISFLIRFVPRKYLQLVSGWGLKVVGFVLYRGNTVQCPVCNHQYREFLPYGRISVRKNALCPNCLSLERHRLIFVYLKNETDFFTSKKSVLHIAPELCFMKQFEAKHGDTYITADIESPLAKVKMDIHEMPFADKQFDYVLCNHVLEHVRDDIQAMQEIKRVLKPGGQAILQVPFFNPIPEKTFEDPSITDKREREKIFGQDDHVRKYGNDYPDRMKQAGLTPDLIHLTKKLGKEKCFAFGLAKGEILYTGKNLS
ncbi:MAG: methyltransferase domain-containing protein [Cyclobacteriaceae bacterium]|nr:methyltransferase domain-containing protein [Cytophagales bacterium]MCZ8327513.1 methyltransferase domain-containing protein [Cyclobacteriaceae bacterium]